MSEVLALVDIGSNAVRFSVVHIRPGRHYRILREERVQTRLAGSNGRLHRDAIAKTVTATRRFLRSLQPARDHRLLAIATAAVRDASNAQRLLGALRRSTGIEVEVLSGEAEARLGALAALGSLPLRSGLVLDLGGGSAQLTRVRRGAIEPLASVPLGVVRTTRRFLRHDPPTARETSALRRDVGAQLAVVLAGIRRVPLVALGGSARALGRIHLKAAPRRRRRLVHGLRLDDHDVAALRATLESLPLRRRRRVPGLKAERADVIVAGAVVIEEIMALVRAPVLTICERGVRHGLLIRETFGLEKRV